MSQTPPSRPGPNARAWVERDAKVVSHSYTRTYPLVVQRAYGLIVEDVDGHRYLDFTSGLGTSILGHCHPDVVKAIHDQATAFIHMSGTDFYYPSQIKLAEELAKRCPGDEPKHVFFSNSGAEAIEAAIKLARYHTKRPHLISFYGGFHGRTLGALSLSASKTVHRRGFGPLLPSVSHAPYGSIEGIEALFATTVPPDEVAAIVVEPIQGEGGYVVPPPGFCRELSELCHRHGILYVADEIQSGMGRTGKFLASEHEGVVPDIVVLSKGLAAGMPLGATIAPARIMDWPPGSHANTFGGHPISCETALVALQHLDGGLIAHAAEAGTRLIAALGPLVDRSRLVGDVRGKALMVGVEIVKDQASKLSAPDARNRIIQRCFEKGLLLVGAGRSVVRFLPALVVSHDEINRAVSIFAEAVMEIDRELPRAA
ncbi:MAG: aminotransferase class III-fold pyridoxal phosphate-dependent enzyme [Nitrospirae bacterium]|nr:aminotransferase class III-fold pyridoxal phosphate-dependent enzyme [Nitrospirota bacterium]